MNKAVEEQKLSTDKYFIIFLRQMGAIVFIIFHIIIFIIFRNTRRFENWGISLGFPGRIQSRDAFRPITRERKYLIDYKRVYLLINYKSWLSYVPGCLNHEAVELHGKIYVVGGVLGSKNQEQTMECYDHVTESWSSLSPPRQRRYNHCAVSLDEYIYVIGGNELQTYCDRIVIVVTKTKTL